MTANDGAQEPSPATVFLSYARGDDEAFVRRLHDDLESHGIDAWFDRTDMPQRPLTFHQEIEDAIRKRDRLIYVGGPSAASSDYVRHEWRSAIAMDKHVIPILRMGEYEDALPGQLALLHCEDFRDNADYESKLAKLVDNLRRSEPPLGALKAVPNLPHPFLARPQLMRRVKDALLVDLHRPVVVAGATATAEEQADAAHQVGVQGMGGIGKSVLAAAVARDREVRRAYPDGIVWVSLGQQCDVAALMRECAAQLGCESHFATVAEGKSILKEFLVEKAVLFVLDDVWDARDAQAFDVHGPRCRTLVTTRDAGILNTLQGELLPVELLTVSQARQLLAEITRTEPVALPAEANEIVRECGCLPLAVALAGGMVTARFGTAKEAERARAWSNVLERLRRADLEKIRDRHAINPQHENIWRAMAASVDVLSDDKAHRFAELSVFNRELRTPHAAVALLWAHTGELDDLDTDDLLVELAERSLLRLDVDENGCRRVWLHDLLYDFASRIAGDEAGLHERLLDAYREACPNGWHDGPNDGYFYENLCYNLARAAQHAELADLLIELRWLEAKNHAGLTYGMPLDFALAMSADAIPADHRQVLRILAEAIRRDIDFIARHADDYPQSLFQSLWNLCWWYDCPDRTTFQKQPNQQDKVDGGGHEGPVGAVQRLLETWRAEKERRDGEFLWCEALCPPSVPLGLGQQILQPQTGAIIAARFAEDDVRIIAVERKRQDDATTSVLFAWDTETHQAQQLFEVPECRLGALALSPDGRRLALGGIYGKPCEDGILEVDDEDIEEDESVVLVYEAASGALVARHSLANNPAMRLSYCENGNVLVCFDGDALRAWHADGEEVAFSLASPEGWHEEPFLVDQGGRTVASVQGDFKKARRRLKIRDAAVSEDGKRIAVVAESHVAESQDESSYSYACCHLLLFARAGSQCELTGVAHLTDLRGAPGVSIDMSPSGSSIVVCLQSFNYTRPARILHLDRKKLDVLGTFALSGPVLGPRVRFHPSGTRAAVSGAYAQDYFFSLLDLESPPPDTRPLPCDIEDLPAKRLSLPCFLGHSGNISNMMWSRDGCRLLTSASDGTARVWDTSAQMTPLVRPVLDKGTPHCAAFSRDGRRIAIGCADYKVRIWDLRTCDLRVELKNFRNVTDVEFCGDGKRIWSRCEGSPGVPIDHVTYLWDAAAGEELLNDWPDRQGHRTTEIPRPAPIAPSGDYRIDRRGAETAIVEEATGTAAAWLPIRDARRIVPSPDEGVWAVIADDHLHLVKIMRG